MKRLTAAVVTVLIAVTGAHAQGMFPGRFAMEWVDVTRPVSSNLPDITYGNTTVDLRDAAGECPPTSRYSIIAPFGFGSETWCFHADGTFDSSHNMFVGGTVWYAPSQNGTSFDVFQLEAEHGSRGCCTIHAVGRRVATSTPTPSAQLRPVITSPKAGVTITGVTWITAWSGASSGTARFELFVDNVLRGTATKVLPGPGSIRLDTGPIPNGVRKLKVRATVGTASGTSPEVSVTVQ